MSAAAAWVGTARTTASSPPIVAVSPPKSSSATLPPEKRQANYAPASQELAQRVDFIGSQICAANPQIGMRPAFITIGSPSVEIFHKEAMLFATSGLRVGMTNTDGVYVEGRQIDSGDCSGPKSARNVLLHPDVDAAVFETARGGILREGLGFDRCSVAVVTNLGAGDHLGISRARASRRRAGAVPLFAAARGASGRAVDLHRACGSEGFSPASRLLAHLVVTAPGTVPDSR